jgi:hypothetical protein
MNVTDCVLWSLRWVRLLLHARAIHIEQMVRRDGKPLGTFYADEVDYKAGKSPALGHQHLEGQLH